MFRYILLFHLLPFPTTLLSQETQGIVRGVLRDRNDLPIVNGEVYVEGTTVNTKTDELGRFVLEMAMQDNIILNISAPDFIAKRMSIDRENGDLDLRTIYLERDIRTEQTDNLITLTDSELLDDGISAISMGFLQATRDVFLKRAAFDFGQAFFRVRGYDAQNGQVLINGIPMNKFFDGRPQWNNWGGLNDVTRNQEFTNGLTASDYTFGGILGNTHIDTRPSGLREGTRLSTSFSNRTYAGRIMATHNSGLNESGFAYAVSASRRWANEGYIDGTLYDAYSFFAALEYHLNTKNSVQLTGILASNRRGRSAAITEEVFELAGRRYNPYWGEQNGEIRSSRERKIAEPIIMLNHFYASDAIRWNTGISYQYGTHARSRLGYYNGPNPDPSYYRYLPSFYVNSPIGANFVSANKAKEGFMERPQMNWDRIYTANATERATYVLLNDIADDSQLVVNSVGNIKIDNRVGIDFGITYKTLTSENYALIDDLLGADFHEDIDPFSNTRNDLRGDLNKRTGDKFNYQYKMDADQFDVFAQFRYKQRMWNVFLAGTYAYTEYQRRGLFLNERFPNNSLGRSHKIQFSDYGLKAGMDYHLNGRHVLTAHGAYLTRPPVLQNVFINPRENNETVPGILSETISSMDLNYFLRFPKVTGRATGYYTRFQNMTDINFFFVDAGVGSDFVQEVSTELDQLYLGVELGLEYEITSSITLSAVASVGKHLYANNPLVSINFDTAGPEEDLIDPKGNIDLGPALVKDYRLAQGPQQAYSLGVAYRDPKYWWIGATTNYLTNNYANISAIRRTQSFYLDPETSLPFPEATEENVEKLLAQKPLDNFYLLNVVGGKSWLKKGKYISIFVSMNNLFDVVFRTGGYEQGRNGNFGQLQQDNLSGTPSFASKHWYGYGRTFFLNLAYSF